MKSGEVDAVLIATPHYLHPVLAIKALNSGLHTLVETPAGVYTKAVREMNEVTAKSDKVFGMMFNQRTNPLYKKLKKMIEDGELGKLRRVNWIITNWYRTQNYYDSGSWRATWEGEGGGVLLNQSPHQIDLIQWLCDMPTKVMVTALTVNITTSKLKTMLQHTLNSRAVQQSCLLPPQAMHPVATVLKFRAHAVRL